MIVIHGTRLYGRVDVVPGLFCVATKFLHIFWIPVLPLGNQIVLAETDRGWRGVPFGLSGKSVLAGYMRGLLIGGGLLAAGVGTYLYFKTGGEANPGGRMFLWGLVSVVVGLVALTFWRDPSPERFAKLCAHLQIDPSEVVRPGADAPTPDHAAARPAARHNAPSTWRADQRQPAAQDSKNPYAG